jgi:hypothetical protein
LRSIDGGATFASLPTPSSSVNSITVDPGDSQRLYAGTVDRGFLFSTDGGASWTASNTGISPHGQTGGPLSIGNVWIDPTNPAIIFAVISEFSREAQTAAQPGKRF